MSLLAGLAAVFAWLFSEAGLWTAVGVVFTGIAISKTVDLIDRLSQPRMDTTITGQVYSGLDAEDATTTMFFDTNIQYIPAPTGIMSVIDTHQLQEQDVALGITNPICFDPCATAPRSYDQSVGTEVNNINLSNVIKWGLLTAFLTGGVGIKLIEEGEEW
jgi:hypothetical protein